MANGFVSRARLIVKELKKCGVDEYAALNFVSSKRCEIIWAEKDIRIDTAALVKGGDAV